MLSQLPERADPRRLCEQGKSYAGSVALKDFPRLTPLLASTEGEAAFTLEFDRDAERRLRIRGRVQASLQLQCQRCMADMTLTVDKRVQLSPVSGPREAENLPEDYDPLLLEEQLMQPLALVEDEFILAIPPAPRHPETQCGVRMADFRQEPEPEPDADVRSDNPFAVLAELKRDNNDE